MKQSDPSQRPTIESDTSRPETSGPAIPRRIGDYEVIDEIGRGGMGLVLRARQDSLGRTVALKLIRDGWFASERARRRFEVEAEAAASLKHPNIVTIHEAGEAEGLSYFSMELVEGRGLDAVLAEEGTLEPRRAARLMRSVAAAVDHAHRSGILHCDLKPANVLVDRHDQPKVADFGLARRLTRAATESQSGVAGTPCYMAPEQVAGREGEVGPATDVYGLGAMLYELLTGRPPFQADHLGQLMLQVLDGQIAPVRTLVRGVPRDLEAICMRCLETDPRRRYETAAALAQDLRSFLGGRPVLAGRGGLASRIRHWLLPRPALSLTWLALAVFYTNQSVLFAIDPAKSLEFHLNMTWIVVLWALGALVAQILLERTGRVALVRYAWSTMDLLMLSAVLWIAAGPRSPLVVGYLLIVMVTGFRWRPWLVVYVTGLAAAAYLLLIGYASARRPDKVPDFDDALVFLVALLVAGAITAALVRRMKGLAGLR
jgi:serine/threonine-protein kinase